MAVAAVNGRAQGSLEEGPQDGALGGGKKFLLLVPHLPTQHHRIHAHMGGRVGLSGSLGIRAWAGASPRISGGGLGLGGPCCLSLRHPAHRPLPPAPAWPVQLHKALFMAGGWPGAPEGGWGRRGGSCTRGQRTSGSVRGRPRHHHPALWGWTLGRSGLLPSPLPSCWPAPSPGPSFPATATAHPCHVKGGRRGAGSREGTSGWLGWGWGPWISKRRAEAPTR